MKAANSRVEFEKEDFEFSDKVSAEASETKIIAIDWARLFKNNKYGKIDRNDAGLSGLSAASVPVIGPYFTNASFAKSYALYKLMKENESYDAVFYPTFETKVSRPILGIGFIFKKTEVKAAARLGKIKQ